jgi:hypothetical protein
MAAVFGADELRGDADARAGPAYAPFQHVRDAQRFGNPTDVLFFAAESERRSTRDHLQPGNLRQQVNDFFRQTVAEIFLLLVRAHVSEGQNGDRGR